MTEHDYQVRVIRAFPPHRRGAVIPAPGNAEWLLANGFVERAESRRRKPAKATAPDPATLDEAST